MRIRKLTLENFGPFKSYDITFPPDDHCCVLFTGKNNEGKSNIIFALKLVSSAINNIGKSKLRTVINNEAYFKLPQQDVSNINIGRVLHNYGRDFAHITAEFDDGLLIEVTIDEQNNSIYAEPCPRLKGKDKKIIGFIPPLGPLAETETLLSEKHIIQSINSSLAPQHLRNHLMQVLDRDEVKIIRKLVNTYWPSIELLDGERIWADNSLLYFFSENGVEREIAWAGQGLQVWFQIITHLVRLRYYSILVLDEPEINLHPEKQNDLINILENYYYGDTIIATHSMELMNNVNVSHILHVQKSQSSPKIKSSSDKAALEVIRSKVGSTFNLIASQFENSDLLFFTEDTYDYKTISSLAQKKKITSKSLNIPIHGFSEYRKAEHFKEAYDLLIGKKTRSVLLLDRDYYPEEYLEKIRNKLEKKNIYVFFTTGKEIENYFIHPQLLESYIDEADRKEFQEYWDKLYNDQFAESWGSFQTLYQNFLSNKKIDPKTVTTKYLPDFQKKWKNKRKRHLFISGKFALKKFRQFYLNKYNKTISNDSLYDSLLNLKIGEIEKILRQIYI